MEQEFELKENKMMKRIKTIKESIFLLFHEIIKKRECSYFEYYFLSILCLIQVGKFSIHPRFDSQWENSSEFLSFIQQGIELLEVRPWLYEITWGVHLIILYVTIGLLCVVILSAGIMAYLLKNKRYNKWIISFLNLVFTGIQTFLFLPILEIFLSISECKSVDNSIRHRMHNDVSCFDIGHTMLMILSIFFMLIYLFVSIFIVVLYFESQKRPADRTSRRHSYADISEIFIKIILQFFAVYFPFEELDWLFAVVQLGLWSILTSTYIHSYHFHSSRIAHFNKYMNSFKVWISFYFLLSFVSLTEPISGSLYIMIFIGLPIIGIVLSSLPEPRIGLINKKLEEVRNGQEAVTYVEFLGYTMFKAGTKERISSILLEGYLASHPQKCDDPHCSVRQYFVNVDKGNKGVRKPSCDLRAFYRMSINRTLLTFHLNEIFIKLLRRFPSYIPLRLEYLQFLIEFLRNNELTIEAITITEKKSKNFDEEFCFYHFQRIFNEQMIDTDGTKVDIGTLLAYEKFMKAFKLDLDKATFCYSNIWNLLIDPHPDLHDLQKYGLQIEALNNSLDLEFDQITQINPNSAKIARIYSWYSYEVVNDRTKSKILLRQSRQMVLLKIKNKNIKILNLHKKVGCIESHSADGSPAIALSSEPSSFGKITHCNSAFCRTFGHPKSDLISAYYNLLFPKIYAEVMNNLLSGYSHLAENADDILKIEYFFLGKHRSGYIFPTLLKVAEAPSISNNFNFVLTVALEKKFASSFMGMMLLDPYLIISEMTSSCSSLVNISKSMIHSKDVHVKELFPSLKGGCKQTYFSSLGDTIMFECATGDFSANYNKNPPTTNTNLSYLYSLASALNTGKGDQTTGEKKKQRVSIFTANLPALSLDSNEEKEFHCWIKRIYSKHGDQQSEVLGFYLILEDIIHRQSPHQECKMKEGMPTFQFVYDDEINMYVRDICEEDVSASTVTSWGTFGGIFSRRDSMASTVESVESMYRKRRNRWGGRGNTGGAGGNTGGSTGNTGGAGGGRELSGRQQPPTKDRMIAIFSNMKKGVGDEEGKEVEVVDDDHEDHDDHDDEDDDDIGSIKDGGQRRGIFRRHEEDDEVCNSMITFYSELIGKLLALNNIIDFQFPHMPNLRAYKFDLDAIRLKDQMYDKNITTYTLINGVYSKNTDLKFELIKEALQQQKAIKKKEEAERAKEEARLHFLLTHQIKGKNDFERVLLESGAPMEIPICGVMTILFFLIVLTLAIIDVNFAVQDLQNLGYCIDFNFKTQHQITDLMYIMYYSKELILINERQAQPFLNIYYEGDSTYTVIKPVEYSLELEHKLKAKVTIATSRLKDINTITSVIQDSEELRNNASEMVIPMTLFSETEKNNGVHGISLESLTGESMQILATAFVLSEMPFEDIRSNHPRLRFILYNGHNTLTNNLLYNYKLHEKYFDSNVLANSKKTDALFIAAMALCVLMIPLYYIILFKLESKKTKIFYLFLDIPRNLLKVLHKRCHEFRKKIKSYHDLNYGLSGMTADQHQWQKMEDLVSIKLEDQKLDNKKELKERKKYAFGLRSYSGLIIYFLICVFIIIFYFGEELLYTKMFHGKVEETEEKFADSQKLGGTYLFTQNYYREYFYDNNVELQEDLGSKIAEKYSNEPYEYKGFSRNIYMMESPLLSNSDRSALKHKFEDDICLEYQPFRSLQDCHEFKNGLLTNGLNILISYFNNKLRNIYRNYHSIKTLNSTEFIKTESELSEIFFLYEKILDPSIHKVVDIFNNSLKDALEGIKNFKISLIIAFCFALISSWSILGPIVLHDYRLLFLRLKKMLGIIPLDIVLKIHSIFEYLELHIGHGIKLNA